MSDRKRPSILAGCCFVASLKVMAMALVTSVVSTVLVIGAYNGKSNSVYFRGAVYGCINLFAVPVSWNLWWTAFPKAMHRRTWRRLVTAMSVSLAIFRMWNIASGPVGTEEHQDPTKTTLFFKVAWDLFFFTNFSFIYFIPCILYGYLTGGFGLCCPRRAALHRATREAEEAEAGEAASGHPPVLDGNKVTLMSFGAASMIAYAFTSKMLEVTGINILWMAPAVAVPWTAGLLIDRCVYRGKLISNNRGYIITLSLLYNGLPIGMGGFMLTALVAAEGDPTAQFIVVLAWQFMVALTFWLWRHTALACAPDVESAVPGNWIFLWFVELFTEFVFLEVQPLSALFWLLLVGTVGVAVVSYPQLHRDALHCLKTGTLEFSPQHVSIVYRDWRIAEQKMFTDNMGCLTVILSLSVELLLVRLGWTPRLLTANVPTDVIALLMLGYFFRLAAHAAVGPIVRIILHRKLEHCRALHLDVSQGDAGSLAAGSAADAAAAMGLRPELVEMAAMSGGGGGGGGRRSRSDRRNRRVQSPGPGGGNSDGGHDDDTTVSANPLIAAQQSGGGGGNGSGSSAAAPAGSVSKQQQRRDDRRARVNSLHAAARAAIRRSSTATSGSNGSNIEVANGSASSTLASASPSASTPAPSSSSSLASASSSSTSALTPGRSSRLSRGSSLRAAFGRRSASTSASSRTLTGHRVNASRRVSLFQTRWSFEDSLRGFWERHMVELFVILPFGLMQTFEAVGFLVSARVQQQALAAAAAADTTGVQ